MDRRIRQLERRAAVGDYEAEEELARIRLSFDLHSWHNARERLVDNPESMEAWARYIETSHKVKKDPSLGHPYYRLLKKDIVNLLYNVTRDYVRFENSPKDTQGRVDLAVLSRYLNTFIDLADAGISAPYVVLTHPMHYSDREKYGMIVSLIFTQVSSGSPYRLYARIKRDGTITYWIATPVVGQSPSRIIPNVFDSAASLIFFFYEVILSLHL